VLIYSNANFPLTLNITPRNTCITLYINITPYKIAAYKNSQMHFIKRKRFLYFAIQFLRFRRKSELGEISSNTFSEY